MALAQTSPFDPHLQVMLSLVTRSYSVALFRSVSTSVIPWHFAYLQQDGKFLGLAML